MTISEKLRGIKSDAIDHKSHAAYFNHATMARLLNKAGVALEDADVVVLKGATDKGVGLVSAEGEEIIVAVIPGTVDGDDSDVATSYADEDQIWAYVPFTVVPKAEVDGAVSLWEWLETSSTADKFTGTGSVMGTDDPPSGTCAVALEAAGSATEIMIGLFMPYYISPDTGLNEVASDLTDATVTNTTDETTIFTTTLSGGTLGTDNCIIIEGLGTVIETAASDLTLRLKYGSTTMVTLKFQALTGGTPQWFALCAKLWAEAATNAQEAEMIMWGAYDNAATCYFGGEDGTASEDSTGDLTLSITAQFSVADAANTLVLKALLANMGTE